MATAWMIRNDGKAFPVTQHIYANPEEIEETLYAAEWLYKNTNHSEVKEKVLELIYAWGISLGYTKTELIKGLTQTIEGKPFKFISKEFVKSIEIELLSQDIPSSSPEALSVIIATELNQEFLRARYGGLYNTSAGSKEMVFRISSSGFNWYNIIFNFVAEASFKIDTITIVRDEESTGAVDSYYRTHDGRNLYKQLPIDDFYAESGNPVVEKEHLFYKATYSGILMQRFTNLLAEGESILSLYNLPLNSDRVAFKLSVLNDDEMLCVTQCPTSV